MNWVQLSFALGDLDAGSAERACLDLGALSVTLSDGGDQPVLEPEPGTTPLWSDTRLAALFDGSVPQDQLVSRLAGKLGIETGRIHGETLADRNWTEEWKKGFRPLCFGGRLWICPGGMQPDNSGGLIVNLDPGLAFGTGSHPSTAMCLEWLARASLEGKTVTDYGCGSGILALAAARLGAGRVLATDIDPQALIASRENARRNALDTIVLILDPDAVPAGETDILVANILANPLRELAPHFARLVRPGGRIVLSGILSEQAEKVTRTYQQFFDMACSGQRDGWALLAGFRHLEPAG